MPISSILKIPVEIDTLNAAHAHTITQDLKRKWRKHRPARRPLNQLVCESERTSVLSIPSLRFASAILISPFLPILRKSTSICIIHMSIGQLHRVASLLIRVVHREHRSAPVSSSRLCISVPTPVRYSSTHR